MLLFGGQVNNQRKKGRGEMYISVKFPDERSARRAAAILSKSPLTFKEAALEIKDSGTFIDGNYVPNQRTYSVLCRVNLGSLTRDAYLYQIHKLLEGGNGKTPSQEFIC